MKRMNFTLSEQIERKLKEASKETNTSMSRIIENALWVYLMMQSSNRDQTQLLNKQIEILLKEMDQRQLTIDDILKDVKP